MLGKGGEDEQEKVCIHFYLPDGNGDPVAGSLRPSNKQHFQSRSQGALLPENFIAVFQDFHMKPFNTECLAKVQQCFSAAGLPVQLARLPKVAHCVLGKWV